LINEAVPLPLELDGIEADQGTVNMEEIVAVNDEMHTDCGLGISECGKDLRKSKILIPNSEIY